MGEGASVDNIWCADATKVSELPSEVGIIEIAGDRSKGMNVQPGYDDNAAYDAERDGEMIPAFCQDPAQLFWNWAMRAGWQKWRPNYRYGTITAINYDDDTCDVSLDACYATDTPDGKQLDINQSSWLSGIAIEYMSCNSAAFEVGDEVIVKFENNDWGSPKVIGFKQEPKGCFWETWGETLCKNHDWYAEVGETWPDFTPPPPCTLVSWDSLIKPDGGLYRLQGNPVGNEPYLQWTWYRCDSPDIDLSENSVMVLKWNSICTGSNAQIFIALYSTGSGSVRHAFHGNSSYVPPPNPYYQDHVIGCNGGEEMTVDLASYGLSGQLSTIIIVAAATKGSIDYWIDYIDFRAPT